MPVLVCQEESEEPVDQVEQARTVLEKLVETRRIIAAEKRDWKVGKSTLQDQIDLVQREIGALRDKMREAEASIAEVGAKRQRLDAENERLIAAAADLENLVVPLETATHGLLVRLPAKIGDQVRPLSQRIPDHRPKEHDAATDRDPDRDPEAASEKKIDLGERFRNLIGTLNLIDKFNTEVTVGSEVRELADRTTSEVAVIYLGIGHAWFVTAKGDHAGYGTATSDGWVWQPLDDAAQQIALAIAVYRNEKAAAFIPLPIRIH